MNENASKSTLKRLPFYLDLLKQQKDSRRLPNGMFKCENCSSEHDGSYGSGRFCCKECAKQFAVKNAHNTGKFKKHLEILHTNKRKKLQGLI